MLWAASVGCDVWLADFGLSCGAEFNFCLFGSFTDSLDGFLIESKVYSGLLFKLVDDVFLQAMIVILTSKRRITIS